MNFYFLPKELQDALKNLNFNFLTEIRLRSGQPVIIGYSGEYRYINSCGPSVSPLNVLKCVNAEQILYSAMENCVYPYTEQLKRGFITVEGGIRIGIAGEYVVEANSVVTIKNVTSLNIRIPHEVIGCADEIYKNLFDGKIKSILLFSLPGYGKTTILRDIARRISKAKALNILIFDERNEISGCTGTKPAFDLGETCDFVRGANKQCAFENAIRVMKPDLIITDELYGESDLYAIRRAVCCGISVIASTHVTDSGILKSMPFANFVELTGIGKEAIIYDENFNFVCRNNTVGSIRSCTFK